MITVSARPADSTNPVLLDRAPGSNGELVLRRAGRHFEIISNGMFLMDTRNGESERLLVDTALAGRPGPLRLLIGGLGVGFTLAAAVRHPHVTVTVVEIEPVVIEWHRTHLRTFSAAALDDPRVRVECADLHDWLHTTGERYDAICLDVDNGPAWTVTEANGRLYDSAGLSALRRRLMPGGVVAVWSAAASAEFEQRLRSRFPRVVAHQIPVPRGEPDVIYLAHAA